MSKPVSTYAELHHQCRAEHEAKAESERLATKRMVAELKKITREVPGAVRKHVGGEYTIECDVCGAELYIATMYRQTSPRYDENPGCKFICTVEQRLNAVTRGEV